MLKKITSTELKVNTRKVIKNVVENPDNPTVVYNYKEPKVVIVSYELWVNKVKKKIKPSLKEMSKFFIETKKEIDSTRIIRNMRDE